MSKKTEQNGDSLGKRAGNRKRSHKKIIWVILVVVAVLVIGLIGALLMKHHSDAKQAELKTELASVRSESKTKQSESVKATSASRVSAKKAKKAAESSQAAADSASASSVAAEQAAESSQKAKQATGSIKNAIQKYFTAYQIFVVTEKTDKQRAQEMGKYATSGAVEDLITKRQQNQADQASVKGIYSWTKPMQITRNGGQSYTVVLYYTLVVGHNASKYKDTYSVETNGKELTHVKQESAEAL